MKHKRIILIILTFATVIWGQMNPVTVSASARSAARAGEVVHVEMTAEMEHEWHIYALHDAGEGPIATVITIKGDYVSRQGKIDEPEPIEKYDKGFETITRYHEGTTRYTIPVQLDGNIDPGKIRLSATILFQVCNASLCYPPKEVTVDVPIVIEAGEPRKDHIEFVAATITDASGNIDLDAAISQGFWPFVILALTMGFLALLTPCVFPMIPITVSYFTHQGELEDQNPIKQASIYGLGIIATFTLLGLILAITLGASGANQLAANPWVNLFIGALFTYFALSLFGMYEIQLPTSLRQLFQNQEGRGGYIGTLFMAVTFTLTSFTCTVQFVGLLLVAAAQGQWFWPMLGMMIFSAAFALPFFFLALFPQYLARMPKSGGWLNSVKVVMGFLEMAAAFKFFSNTDLVWNWQIFTHISVLAIWAILMFFTGFYLLGKIQLPHDSKIEIVSVPRMMLSIFFLAFALYLSTGLFGRPIHGLIYSYLPPKLTEEVGMISEMNGGEELQWYTELDDAFVEANMIGKNIFVDFTGYTCTNCRWMESNIFTKDEVKDRFKDFVLVRLYTDGGNNYREKQQYEIDRFGTAALPYYVILSPEDDVLGKFPGMTRNQDEFLKFLDKGLTR
ncbi:MAG: cytochrome c biogenesis protein CcdA [Candidatus Marinimicrobia bacterium]|jgi:thiol:disulfide interchange protein DsbD|nr:cytochrome c biogenesis protein CcdA [Candidatus Neomarinimicrobiota bacterium]MDP6726867.1 cytochrome c biogenesis protein CcdA [Candidatus Neomarinimicrobiota bacterium]